MTWPFENDTSAITKKLAKKSLQSEKRRNLMMVIAVALAAFLICFTGIVSTSLTQMQRNQVVDTYEAVWLGVEENDIETLKGLPEFERVGGYYMLGEELSERLSCVLCVLRRANDGDCQGADGVVRGPGS